MIQTGQRLQVPNSHKVKPWLMHAALTAIPGPAPAPAPGSGARAGSRGGARVVQHGHSHQHRARAADSDVQRCVGQLPELRDPGRERRERLGGQRVQRRRGACTASCRPPGRASDTRGCRRTRPSRSRTLPSRRSTRRAAPPRGRPTTAADPPPGEPPARTGRGLTFSAPGTSPAPSYTVGTMARPPALVSAAAALAQASAAGPYFTIHPWSSGAGWRPLGALTSDPAALSGRVGHARGVLARQSGIAPADVEERVAASTVFLGLASQLASPLLGAAVVGGVVPRLAVTDLWWRPADGGLWPLAAGPAGGVGVGSLGSENELREAGGGLVRGCATPDRAAGRRVRRGVPAVPATCCGVTSRPRWRERPQCWPPLPVASRDGGPPDLAGPGRGLVAGERAVRPARPRGAPLVPGAPQLLPALPGARHQIVRRLRPPPDEPRTASSLISVTAGQGGLREQPAGRQLQYLRAAAGAVIRGHEVIADQQGEREHGPGLDFGVAGAEGAEELAEVAHPPVVDAAQALGDGRVVPGPVADGEVDREQVRAERERAGPPQPGPGVNRLCARRARSPRRWRPAPTCRASR